MIKPGFDIIGMGGVVIALEADNVRAADNAERLKYTLAGSGEHHQVAWQRGLYGLFVPFEQGQRGVDSLENGVFLTCVGQVSLDESDTGHKVRPDLGPQGIGKKLMA